MRRGRAGRIAGDRIERPRTADDPSIRANVEGPTDQVDRFIEAKMSEWDSFRLQVTPWELSRYLSQY